MVSLVITSRHALREAEGKPWNAWIKAVGVAIGFGVPADHGHKPKDCGHKLKDQGHKLKDQVHKPNDHGHKPKDHGHKLKDNGHKPNDHRHRPKDRGNKPNDRGHKPNDRGHKPKDHGHKPKNYCLVRFVTPYYLVGNHVVKSRFILIRGNITLISAAITTASVTCLKFLCEIFTKVSSDVHNII